MVKEADAMKAKLLVGEALTALEKAFALLRPMETKMSLDTEICFRRLLVSAFAEIDSLKETVETYRQTLAANELYCIALTDRAEKAEAELKPKAPALPEKP